VKEFDFKIARGAGGQAKPPPQTQSAFTQTAPQSEPPF